MRARQTCDGRGQRQRPPPYNRGCIELSALTGRRRRSGMAENEDDMAIALRRRRFTLDEYHRMGETGILGEDDRVELIEGEIIERTPIGSLHAAIVARIHHLLSLIHI